MAISSHTPSESNHSQFHVTDFLVFVLSLGGIGWVLSQVTIYRVSFSLAHVYISAAVAVLLTSIVGILYCNTRKHGHNERMVSLFALNGLALPLGYIVLRFAIALFPSPRYGDNQHAAEFQCLSFASAQEIYHRSDYDNDGVLEYAPDLHALFETKLGAGDLQLIDVELVAAADSLPTPRPKNGYFYRVLTAQGVTAPQGAKSYFDANGNMIHGYALLAFPAEYGITGRTSYMIDHRQRVYEKDMGTETVRISRAMDVFEPDKTWIVNE